MLNRFVFVAFFWVLVVGASAGQAQDSDSQTLHQILVELRAIHEDMRVSETTQLLVAELEMQQGVVSHATLDADNARTRLNEIHLNQKQIGAELDRAEDQLEKAANPDERNAVAQEIERNKSNLAGLKTAERDWTTTLQDMQQRLQNAQDKLANIESELNAAIARLGPVQKDTGQR
jgi:chromosome segregation ATPase